MIKKEFTKVCEKNGYTNITGYTTSVSLLNVMQDIAEIIKMHTSGEVVESDILYFPKNEDEKISIYTIKKFISGDANNKKYVYIEIDQVDKAVKINDDNSFFFSPAKHFFSINLLDEVD